MCTMLASSGYAACATARYDRSMAAEAAESKRRSHFSIFWGPLLVLGIILVAGQLLPGRYRVLSESFAIVALAFGAILEIYAYVEERSSRYSRAILATGILVFAITVLNVAGVVVLVKLLLFGGQKIQGLQMLSSGVYFWGCNVLTFALWFWLIDQGGPHARDIRDRGRAEFLFPEMQAGLADLQWRPHLFEYFYLALTNATAFSPTDTLPLSTRARMLMATEAIISLVIIALVTARAVNILR